MKLVSLTKKEFKKFADKHPQITFHQTEEWANLKKKNLWDSYYIGLKDNNKISKEVSEEEIMKLVYDEYEKEYMEFVKWRWKNMKAKIKDCLFV